MSDLIGNMDEVVEFLQNTPVVVGAGNQDGYALALTTRGYLKRDSGNRAQNFADINGYTTFRLTVRKQAALTALLSMSLKIRINSRIYTIHSWDDTSDMYVIFFIYLKNG